MSKLIKHGVAALSGGALALFLAGSPVWADTTVLKSNVPEIKTGATLKDSARVKLPAGGSINVLVKSTGASKTLKGPYEGTVADYQEDRSWWSRVFGPNKDAEPPMGAMRGIKKPDSEKSE